MEIMGGSDHFYFFGCEAATIDVLSTASNNGVNFVDTQTVLLKC